MLVIWIASFLAMTQSAAKDNVNVDKRRIKMENSIILIIIVGIASIGMAIFGKLRPDIVWKNRINGTVQTPERQQFGFIVLLLFGIMLLLIAGALSVPQWQAFQSAVVITIAIAMTVLMLFPFWKYVLSRIEGFWTISLVLCIIASVALIALCVYYWHVTLN